MDNILQYAGSDESDIDEEDVATMCMICQKLPKRYKCPRCNCMTCSLDCCNHHKRNTGCNGIRDKTGFVSVRNYNEKTLLSDYNFLEDALQSRTAAKRMVIQHSGKDKTMIYSIIRTRHFLIIEMNSSLLVFYNSRGLKN